MTTARMYHAVKQAARKAAQLAGKPPEAQARAATLAGRRFMHKAQLQDEQKQPGIDPFLPFQEAIRAARERDVVLPDVYYGELQGVARQKAFSIAGETRMGQLEQALGELQKVMSDGGTLRDFQRRVREGEAPLDLPRHRIENILRTNTQGALAAGRCEHHARHKSTRPYLRYSAVNDSRTRASHAAQHGRVEAQDSQFWSVWTPPNGYQCRCTVSSLTERQAKRYQARDEERMKGREAAQLRAQANAEGPDKEWDYTPCGEPDAHMAQALPRYRKNMPSPIDKQADAIETGAEAAGAMRSSQWTRVAEKQGSVPGGIYEDPDGNRYIAKFYPDEEQARAEVASQRIHELLGVETSKGHITQLPDPSTGEMRTVVANQFRDDLTFPDGRTELTDAMLKAPGDSADIFHASVITGNRDAIGMDFDNVAVTRNGRLASIDTGGSFDFRAQGQRKDYGKDPLEVKGLRDPQINSQAASVFNELENRDAYWEGTGASKVRALKKKDIQAAFEDAGFSPARVNQLTATANLRKNALVDRYNADNKRSYKGYGKHEKVFKRMGTAKWNRTGTASSGHLAVDDRTYRGPDGARDAINGFERYVESQTDSRGTYELKSTLDDWSNDSSNPGGAAMKLWSYERYGNKPNYHHRRGRAMQTGDAALEGVKRDAEEHFRNMDISKERMFRLLDIEHEYSRYQARRATGYDGFTVSRYMSDAEYDANMSRGGQFQGNAAMSFTQKNEGGFSGQKKIDMDVRAEDTMKFWWQGEKFMSYGENEAEIIVMGGKKPARRSN